MSHVERFHRPIALLLAFFCLWSVTLASSSGAQMIEVEDVTVQANLVVVQLVNSGSDARTLTVSADVVLKNGAHEKGSASVFVDGKASASVVLAFSAEVQGVDQVGISDQSEPF